MPKIELNIERVPRKVGMFGAFLDESSDDHNAGLFVVAAILGDGWSMLKAETPWKKLLQQIDKTVFKASKWGGRPDVVCEFARVIVDSGVVCCSVAINQVEFSARLGNSGLHKQFRENPYMLCYHQTFVELAEALSRRTSRQKVAFVCDENSRYRDAFTSSYLELKQLNPKSAAYMGSCSFAPDERCIPLQMADLIASEVRRAGGAWGTHTTTLSSALRLLVDSEVLFRVRLLSDPYLRSVRHLVDLK